MSAAAPNADLSKAIKSYILADEKLSTLRSTAKETRDSIKLLSNEICQAMLASELNIVRVPSANCELELKQKDTQKKEPAPVKRIREALEPLRGKTIDAAVESALLAAAAPNSKEDDDDDENPKYTLKRRKIRGKKADDEN